MSIKTECNYCGKIITNPFIDTDSKGSIYFFCNKEHRDKYSKVMIESALMMNPIGAMCFFWGVVWGFIVGLYERIIK